MRERLIDCLIDSERTQVPGSENDVRFAQSILASSPQCNTMGGRSSAAHVLDSPGRTKLLVMSLMRLISLTFRLIYLESPSACPHLGAGGFCFTLTRSGTTRSRKPPVNLLFAPFAPLYLSLSKHSSRFFSQQLTLCLSHHALISLRAGDVFPIFAFRTPIESMAQNNSQGFYCPHQTIVVIQRSSFYYYFVRWYQNHKTLDVEEYLCCFL